MGKYFFLGFPGPQIQYSTVTTTVNLFDASLGRMNAQEIFSTFQVRPNELTSQVHLSNLIHSNDTPLTSLNGKVTQLLFAFLTI